jgi:hypothetical protein
VQRQLVGLGLSPIDSPAPSELQRFVADEIVRWGAVIERAGIGVE